MTDNETSDPVITVEDLGAHYGAQRILSKISFTVARGEIFVIMGPSGCGKTTLMRHLVGLEPCLEGEIALLDTPLRDISRKALYRLRRKIGVAFQSGALINSLSVLENVALPLRQHTRLDAATIGIMSRMKLEMMNLRSVEQRMPAQLSGGMLKRAGLARAVATDPAILFFDEPSAGLDPVNAADLDELILGLREALRMTIVVVTHELESALKIADRVMILDAGRIVALGTVATIRNHPDRRIQDLLNRRRGDRSMDADAYMDRLTQ